MSVLSVKPKQNQPIDLAMLGPMCPQRREGQRFEDELLRILYPSAFSYTEITEELTLVFFCLHLEHFRPIDSWVPLQSHKRKMSGSWAMLDWLDLVTVEIFMGPEDKMKINSLLMVDILSHAWRTEFCWIWWVNKWGVCD